MWVLPILIGQPWDLLVIPDQIWVIPLILNMARCSRISFGMLLGVWYPSDSSCSPRCRAIYCYIEVFILIMLWMAEISSSNFYFGVEFRTNVMLLLLEAFCLSSYTSNASLSSSKFLSTDGSFIHYHLSSSWMALSNGSFMADLLLHLTKAISLLMMDLV